MSKFEKYTIESIDRKNIKFADYNPRKIKDANKDKLQTNIETKGLMLPLVWNKNTGNLVSGHQRLKAIDRLEKTKDYKITVAIVDLTEEEEKEQNIFFNNPYAQGEFDFLKLDDIIKNANINIENAGIGKTELLQAFGNVEDNISIHDLKALSAEIKENQKKRSDVIKGSKDKNNPNFYIVLVFRDETQRNDFLGELDLPLNKYQNGESFIAKIKNAI